MSTSLPVLLVDAFTNTPGKGNRAGVVLDASGLSDDAMQAVAALLNVSETAFMIPTPDQPEHELEVRYFTPTIEVPICGHATIASHFARSVALGLDTTRVVVKTGAGILPVDVVTKNGEKQIVMTQGTIGFEAPYDEEARLDILAALGLESADLIETLPVQAVSTGHSKVMVPITSVGRVDGLAPDMACLASVSRQIGCNGFFVFAFNPDSDDCLTSGRMFAPAIGIDEDPVTGNANGPCGAYLSRYGVIPDVDVFAYRGRQGVAIGKEGVVEVTVHRDVNGPTMTQVGGTAVISDERLVEIEEVRLGHVVARYIS